MSVLVAPFAVPVPYELAYFVVFTVVQLFFLKGNNT